MTYLISNGLERVVQFVASAEYELNKETKRRRAQYPKIATFGLVFLVLVAVETALAGTMLGILDIEVMGHAFSGALFALFVPTLLVGYHIKTHHDGDEFLKATIKRLSTVGIFLLAIGLSIMVGFSAWSAATEATNSFNSGGPSGSFGTLSVSGDGGDGVTASLIRVLSPIPTAMLFLGLSFGMIISIYVASFCLGKFLEAFNILYVMPRRSPELLEKCRVIKEKVTQLARLHTEHVSDQRRLPTDPEHAFAKSAA